MHAAFAHDATLRMAHGADIRAPGAAITVALCGHWEHDPPCPLAPHHSRAQRVGDIVRIRILFATEPELETEVRHRIDGALSGGRLRGPDGATTCWQLSHSQVGTISPEEADHAEQLTRF
ncbi:MAG: hypothetical protein ACRDTF_11710 [Pseudonocardiaceae bacterium]